MPLLSLSLLGLLALSASVQLLIQRRRVGASRVRLYGGFASAQMWSTVLTGVAFGAVAGGAILDLADVLVPDDVLDATAGHAAGIALWVFGAGLARTAQLTMGSSWRMGVDETERLELITSGPFRVVRNPIYTGLFAMFAGWALLVPNWVSLAALPLAIAGFELLVRRVEEPYIHRLHGEPFGRWASATGRFVPGVGRVAATSGDAEQAP